MPLKHGMVTKASLQGDCAVASVHGHPGADMCVHVPRASTCATCGQVPVPWIPPPDHALRYIHMQHMSSCRTRHAMFRQVWASTYWQMVGVT